MNRHIRDLGTYSLAVLLGLIAIPGCFYATDKQEVEGAYIAEYKFGTDRLELKPDGTYTQEITLKDEGIVLRGGGGWEYDEVTHRVDFEDLYVLSDGYGNRADGYESRPRGIGSFPVERYFWSRRLRLGPDEGTPYNKQ